MAHVRVSVIMMAVVMPAAALRLGCFRRRGSKGGEHRSGVRLAPGRSQRYRPAAQRLLAQGGEQLDWSAIGRLAADDAGIPHD